MSALILVGPLMGMAQGILENVMESLAKGRGISYTFYARSADAPTTQLNIADAHQLLDTARLHMFRAADLLDTAAREGRYPALLERAQVRMDTGYVASTLRRAVELLVDVAGAGSFATANSTQRQFRDLEVGHPPCGHRHRHQSRPVRKGPSRHREPDHTAHLTSAYLMALKRTHPSPSLHDTVQPPSTIRKRGTRLRVRVAVAREMCRSTSRPSGSSPPRP